WDGLKTTWKFLLVSAGRQRRVAQSALLIDVIVRMGIVQPLCVAEVSPQYLAKSTQASQWGNLVSVDVPVRAADTGSKYGWNILPTKDRSNALQIGDLDVMINSEHLQSRGTFFTARGTVAAWHFGQLCGRHIYNGARIRSHRLCPIASAACISQL
ncbi:hypothetical protein HPB47_024059, partial [Ixodes persulcatus]